MKRKLSYFYMHSFFLLGAKRKEAPASPQSGWGYRGAGEEVSKFGFLQVLLKDAHVQTERPRKNSKHVVAGWHFGCWQLDYE